MPLNVRAVGIDLGTTYSSIAVLNRHGEPVMVPDAHGDTAIPSVVLFDPDAAGEDGAGDEPVVGTAALRTAVLHPDRVVAHSKRFMHDPHKRWAIDGREHTPADVAAVILRHLLGAATTRFGPLDRAVITVPAQFGAAERERTVAAAKAAGLRKVDLIDEPVAAALCHVLGGEGLWFTELADPQTVLVFDLGGGTLDLALVTYSAESVRVTASGGDLHLGGADFTDALRDALAGQFAREFDADPRDDPASLQLLVNEAEQAKRDLSVRHALPLTIQHAGHRKVYRVERAQLERLTADLADRAADLAGELVRRGARGWAGVDAVLLTGGASRTPHVAAELKRRSGTTPNTHLSPDQSTVHGAAYFAGMLLSDEAFARELLGDPAANRAAAMPRTVTTRGVGVLVRDDATGEKVPHYVIPPDTPLPAEGLERFGTVSANQRRIRLTVVQAGPASDAAPEPLGDCRIAPLPRGLPADTPVDLLLSMDAGGRVRAEAIERSGGRRARAELRLPGVAPEPPPDEPPRRRKPLAPPPRPALLPKPERIGEREFWSTVGGS